MVSSRGQITLPVRLRKRLGIKGGDVVILEDIDGEIVLKPGIVLEVQHYTDAQIDDWDSADQLSEEEHGRILSSLTKSKK